MPEASHHQSVVIGAGVVGLATARALARRGLDVALIEQNAVLPARGSSRGDARIRVLAAYPDDEYLELGLLAAERWRELESESGAKLLFETGALSYGEGIESLLAALDRFDVPHEVLGDAQLRHRFPRLHLSDCGQVVHQADGAVIAADRVLEALLSSGSKAGVQLRENERVLSVEAVDQGAMIETSRGAMRADSVTIAAGPWAPGLLPWPDLAMRLRPSLQTVAYFAWEGPPPPALIEYGHPDPYSTWSPGLGLKAADHEPGPDPLSISSPGTPDPNRVQATASWVSRRFPSVDPRPVRTETCLYTNTPDERFLLERRGAICVVSACNGQGFQFAPAVAERVAAMQAE
ncbi:MAG: FAD-dependent oxidoreductase [Solirubrobacterales bacterium]